MPHDTTLCKEKTHELQRSEQVSFMPRSGKHEKRNAEPSTGHTHYGTQRRTKNQKPGPQRNGKEEVEIDT